LSSDPSFTPAYLDLLRSGAFGARVEEALDHLAACDLCPRYCRVDRRDSIKGALCNCQL
jgi:putative pyruvate formate lyase activating enzyme